jgi:hypothetical protein
VARQINQEFERRKREAARTARAAERRIRKQQRSAAVPASRADNGEDPDLAGIVAGPQPREKIPEEEARRAVERAMNPGASMPGEERRSAGTSEVFVGSLDFTVAEDELRQLFVSAGFSVERVSIVRDRATGEPRGFAFVELQGFRQAAIAVAKLDGTELAGRRLRLNVANGKSPSSR